MPSPGWPTITWAGSPEALAANPLDHHHLQMEAKPMKMKMKPLNDRVLVKRMEPEEMVKSGLIIPDTAKEKPMEAKVVAVGAGRLDDHGKRIEMEVKAGDRVLIGKYTGTEVRIEDVEHVIVREEEILGIVI
jgi:chaperonin GroES